MPMKPVGGGLSENHWWWVFTNNDAALYQIDKIRGSKV
jgi:hypothetical protein